MKRYTPEVEPETEWNSARAVMEEDEDGEYVKADDHIEVLNKARRLISLISVELIDMIEDGTITIDESYRIFDIIEENGFVKNHEKFAKGMKALAKKEL